MTLGSAKREREAPGVGLPTHAMRKRPIAPTAYHLQHLPTLILSLSGDSRGNCFAHRPRTYWRQIFSSPTQLRDFFSNQRAELTVGFRFGAAVTNASPREEIRAIPNIKAVLLFPSDELQVLVFDFH